MSKKIGIDFIHSDLTPNGVNLLLINRIHVFRNLPDDELSEALHELVEDRRSHQVILTHHQIHDRLYTFRMNFIRTYEKTEHFAGYRFKSSVEITVEI